MAFCKKDILEYKSDNYYQIEAGGKLNGKAYGFVIKENGGIEMGVSDFDVYGKYKFGKEEQYTHFCLVIEAFSEIDALDKARRISDKVTWTSVSEHNSDDE